MAERDNTQAQETQHETAMGSGILLRRRTKWERTAYREGFAAAVALAEMGKLSVAKAALDLPESDWEG